MNKAMLRAKAIQQLKANKQEPVRFEFTHDDGCITRINVYHSTKAGGWVADIYYQEADEIGFNKSEGLYLDGFKRNHVEQVVDHVLQGGGGLWGRPTRIASLKK